MKRASSKMKLLWKQYGLVAIGTYTVLYVAGLGGVYLVLATGLVDPDVRKTALIPNCTHATMYNTFSFFLVLRRMGGDVKMKVKHTKIPVQHAGSLCL